MIGLHSRALSRKLIAKVQGNFKNSSHRLRRHKKMGLTPIRIKPNTLKSNITVLLIFTSKNLATLYSRSQYD